MKLFMLFCWQSAYGQQAGIEKFVVAKSGWDAKQEELKKGFYASVQCKEISEIQGYKVQLEKIA